MSSDDRLPAVYDALRRLAEQRLAGERAGHTLQATALVHDAYLKLAGELPGRWNDTTHFYHAAAEAMRRTLVDHARARKADKRGGGRCQVSLTDVLDLAALASGGVDPDEVLALDAALARLAKISPEGAEVVKLRFYAGLTVEQTAAAMGVTDRTVRRKWMVARAWLFDELSKRSRE